jgi:hypothetical protein
MKIKFPQSWRTSCAFTRVGFESAPLANTQTGCSSIIEYVWAYTSVGATHTKQPGLLLT